jgi:integrase
MHLMFECATRWELFTEQRNPIALVRVKGGSKRRQRPTTLTVEEFEIIVATLKEPYRTFDFEKNQLLVQRSFVSGEWMTSRPNTPRTTFLCIRP